MAVVVPNSTFLDSFANQQATPAQFITIGESTNSLANAQAVLGSLFAVDGANASVAAAAPADTITLGLVLNRANDPSALLASPWAVRAAALADQTAIWNKYGADQNTYDAMAADIATTVGSASPQATATSDGYLSSATDRTIWLTLDAAQFEALFGTPLLMVTPSGATPFPAWSGNLSLPDSIAPNVGGVWLEEGIRILDPAKLNTAEVDPSALQDGYLGIGNGLLQSDTTPAAVAASYSFPFSAGQSLPTDPIALIEANLPPSTETTLLANYNQYRQELGLPELTADQFDVLRMTAAGNTTWSAGSEFALDISVIAGGAPTSSLLLYTYLTSTNLSASTPFNAYQRAFFDSNNASVLSSSYPVASQPTANSPFQWAWQQLFVDGALSNVSTHVSAGDQGSSGNIANGLANVPNSQASPMALVVGGTSIADLYTAQLDVTLQQMAQSALQGDPATIFSLVASGLTTLPSNLSSSAPTKPQTVLAAMFETVWQRLQLIAVTSHDNTVYGSNFGANTTGLGGAANGVPIPDYQSAFGLSLLTGDARGTPDVAALAGGDNRYAVLNSDYGEPGEALIVADGGTSAATPLWASLTAQFNAVFKDQGLPQLGYYNDLLYTAAVIAPASFNDILLGNNIDSFVSSSAATDYFNTNTDTFMVPTGDGSSAGPGYDLATGLGTPNGTLLARALTLIAHSQTSFSDEPNVIYSDGTGGWTSGSDQSLLFQTSSGAAVNVRLFIGSDSQTYSSTASSPYAWTSRLAEQSLQPDFDPDLVRMFDKQSQGGLTQSNVASDDTIGVNINAASTAATQATLSTSFGFADFDSSTSDSSVRVARPVMVAETAGAADNQNAVVRIRQSGQDSLSVEFYRVDDMNGKINGLSPGDAGYAAAAAARAYDTTSGNQLINGPGYGNYTQTELTGVDAGDLIATALVNNTHGKTYWEFSQANETVGGQSIAHIWNYGANTFGWEDTYGGGDRDYNDLVVGVDFTSTAGSGVLVN